MVMPDRSRLGSRVRSRRLGRTGGVGIIGAVAIIGMLIGSGGCSIGAVLRGMTPGHGAEHIADVRYGAQERQKLDVWRPATRAESGSPVVVFFYGGSWNSGSRSRCGFVGKALAAHGVIAVVADYRLFPEVRYPVFLQDSADAVAWTFREIASMGGDAAAFSWRGTARVLYNAAMLALDPRWLAGAGVDRSRLRGWIGLAGPYDFLPIENPDVKPVFFHPDYPPGTQPLLHADAGAPPTFLGAATDDKLVDPGRNTAQLAKRLRSLGVPVVEKRYSSANHMTLVGAFSGPLRGIGEVLDDTLRFIANTAVDMRQSPAKAPAVLTSGSGSFSDRQPDR